MVAAQTAALAPTTTSANGNLYTFGFFLNGGYGNNQSITPAYSQRPFPEYSWPVNVSFIDQPVQITYSSMELLVGQSMEAEHAVVDIISVDRAQNSTFSGANYAIPSNIPAGYYFIRTNITYSGTKGIASDSVVSPTFYVEAILTCQGLPPYSNVTSPSDPNFSPLFITVPWAGDILELITTAPGSADPEFDVEWNYRDAGAQEGANIENLILEFVQQTTPPTGSYQSAGGFQANASGEYMNYPYKGATLDSPGLWYIRANYSLAGGPPITYLSQPFYISSPNRPNDTCTEKCFGVGPTAMCPNGAGSGFRAPMAAGVAIAGVMTLGTMFFL
ncbi:hypothetical protein FRB98_002118 [Tulasnella sp. 332]|nr:hypothetical protein FRB98_002118 [Tulasnella sp. 332]